MIDIAEFLKFKESNTIWDTINESENEYISDEEIYSIEEIKLKGEFDNQEDVLKELGINTDEIYNRL